MIQHLFQVSNATGGVNQACIAAHSATPDQMWKCNIASGSYGHTKVPIFALNSALDSWQTGCIYTGLPCHSPRPTPLSTALSTNHESLYRHDVASPYSSSFSAPMKCVQNSLLSAKV
jgi:hypothetical protein